MIPRKNIKSRFIRTVILIFLFLFLVIYSDQCSPKRKSVIKPKPSCELNTESNLTMLKLKSSNVCLNAEFSPQHSISVWTLLIDKTFYVRGAIKLGLSVQRHKTIPVDMVILELKSKPLSITNWRNLHRVGWKRCVVNRIAPVQESIVHPPFRDQYTKLHLWRMTFYKSVVYFDSDAFVIGNIDNLLRTNLGSYSIGASRDIGDGRWRASFNMGVFVIHPSIEEYEQLIQVKNKDTLIFNRLMSEQGFLNAVFEDKWCEIGFIYNANLAAYSYKKEFWKEESDIRVIHYTMTKPWECGRVYSKVCELWTNADGF